METRPSFFRTSTGFSGAFAAGPPPQPPAPAPEEGVEAEAEAEEGAETKEDDTAEGHTQRNLQSAPNQFDRDGTINPPFP